MLFPRRRLCEEEETRWRRWKRYCTYHETCSDAATVANPTCRDELDGLARQRRFVPLDQIGTGGYENTNLLDMDVD
jgi:hypothetical protein